MFLNMLPKLLYVTAMTQLMWKKIKFIEFNNKFNEKTVTP